MPSYLLLINDVSYTSADGREVGDIVDVRDATVPLSKDESRIFDIVPLPDKEKIDLKAQQPYVCTVKKSKTTEWTVDEPERKEVWRGEKGDLLEIVKRPRFPSRWEDGKIKENFSRYPENTKTVLIPAI